MSNNAEVNIQARLNELENVHRIVQNTFNLIADVEIKGAHASAVAEILGWLNGFGSTLSNQMKALEETLPKNDVKQEAKEVKEEVKVEA